MNTNEHNFPAGDQSGDDVTGLLHSLGDDEGRPLPKTPEERLDQARTAERRRRTALVSVAGVAAVAVGITAFAIFPLGGDNFVTTEPANTASASADATSTPTLPKPNASDLPLATNPATSNSSDRPEPPDDTLPERTPGLAAKPLVDAADLPTRPGWKWTSLDVVVADGDCGIPLFAPKSKSRDFSVLTGGKPLGEGQASEFVREESSTQAATEMFVRTVTHDEECANDPLRGPDPMARSVVTESSSWADQVRLTRFELSCQAADSECEPIVGFNGTARTGRILVNFSISSNPDVARQITSEEATAALEGAVRLAVAY